MYIPLRPVLNVLLVYYSAAVLCVLAAETTESDALNWNAQYIFTHQWDKQKPVYDPTNLFVLFRKTFELSADVQEGQSYVFADARYQLFVNGRRVGRGPVHSEALFFFYDYYDLKPYLHSGRNVIAVLVNTLGDDGLGWYIPPPWSHVRGVLLFQADLKLTNGQSLSVISDPSWKFHRHEAWMQNTPRVNADTPHMEVYDARLEPTNWQSEGFDDAAWPNAVVIDNGRGLTRPPMEPYFRLLRRPIQHPTESEVWPEKVFSTGETDSAVSPMQELANRTTTEMHYPTEHFRVTPEGADTSPKGYLSIKRNDAPADGRSPYVILDFGRQVVGYLRLDLEAQAGTTIDIAFGEELSPDGHVNATSPGGQYVARYIAKDGPQLWERFEWYGFQWVQLTFRNLSKPVRVRTSLNFSTYPPGKGAFSSSDARLNRIWETARYTLQLCTWDHFLDVTQREQRQYLGDGQLETLAHLAANGDISLLQKFLKDGARTQRSDGLLRMTTGARWPAIDIIPDYDLSWIDSLAAYYLYTGDADLIRSVYPTLVKCLDWFDRNTQPNGLLGLLPYWVFLDFSAPDKRGQSSILNARYYLSLNEASEFAKLVGDQYHANIWSGAAARIKANFDSRFWDAQRGVYVDASRDGNKSPYIGQLANGMAILSGLASEQKTDTILRVIFDQSRVRVFTPQGVQYSDLVDAPPRPAGFDVAKDLMAAQPFGFHFLMMALAKLGRYDLQIAQVKERWGAELDQGATAFWGNWDRYNTLAAGWASTPAYYLTTTILGIRPVEPGFRTFAVEPHTVGLTWAKGIFPSVKGEIPVSWTAAPGRFQIDGTIPDGTRAEILIPQAEGAKPREVRFQGTPIWRSGRASTVADVEWAREEAAGVRVSLIRPGKYEFIALY